MSWNMSSDEVFNDEYTQKAIELYEELNITPNPLRTIQEIAQEYEESIQFLKDQSIENAAIFRNR